MIQKMYKLKIVFVHIRMPNPRIDFPGFTVLDIRILPPEIGNFTALEQLELSVNKMNGDIPEEIGNINNLYFLNISNNNINSFNDISINIHISLICFMG